jgi:hypothetical protein
MEAKVLRTWLKNECDSSDDCTKCKFNGISTPLCCFGDATDEEIEQVIAAQSGTQAATVAGSEQPAVQHAQLAIAARAVMEAWDNPDDSALCNAMVSLRKALQQQA